MEGKEGESFPSLHRLVEYTGINLHTVTDAQMAPRKWLAYVQRAKHTSRDKFSVPIEHTAILRSHQRSKASCSKTINGPGGKQPMVLEDKPHAVKPPQK